MKRIIIHSILPSLLIMLSIAAAPARYDVVLTAVKPGNKIRVIKVLRTHTALGLKECKELTEKTPSVVKSGISRIEADRIQKDLTTSGATADVRPTP